MFVEIILVTSTVTLTCELACSICLATHEDIMADEEIHKQH